jgi:hypothetical protein
MGDNHREPVRGLGLAEPGRAEPARMPAPRLSGAEVSLILIVLTICLLVLHWAGVI